MLPVLAIAVLLGGGSLAAPRQSPGDAAATPAGPVLTLADVLERVRVRSPQIEAARARQQASALARTLVPALPNPVVEFRGENLRPTGGTPLDRDVFATVSQPVELGGKRRARVAEADAVVDVAAAEVRMAEWLGMFDVAQLYVDAVRARDVMATLAAQRDSVAELVSLLQARLDEGVSPEADLRKFETERTRLTAQTARASIALRSALVRLSALVGEDVRPERLVMPPLADLATREPGMPSTALDRRPDVQVAAARVRRAEATTGLERTFRHPDVAVTAGYKRTGGLNTAVAGVSLSVPLFNRNDVAIAYATGELSAAQQELELVRRQASADAEARWTAARELRQQAERVERDLVAPADVVRTAARAAFVEGTGDVLQLVDAERVYGDAAREALELRLDATLAWIHARLAIGDSPLP